MNVLFINLCILASVQLDVSSAASIYDLMEKWSIFGRDLKLFFELG